MRLTRHISRNLTTTAILALLGLGAGRAEAQLAREPGVMAELAGAARQPVLPTESGFALDQLQNQRVLDARVATRFNIKRLFEQRGIRYPAAEMFVRIFKRERTLELWVRATDSDRFELLKNYDICALAGELGPKRQQGDSQVPEGFYTVDFFNPESDYHLSLHVDYPNVKDRHNRSDVNLGGDIYIHGGCNSDGCLAVTDEGIMELYWMGVEARAAGQSLIPVHIFPARLDGDELQRLQRAFSDEPELGAFWATLQPGYQFFEENRRIPGMMVDGRGDYVLMGAAPKGNPRVGSLGAPAPSPAAAKSARPAPLGSSSRNQ